MAYIIPPMSGAAQLEFIRNNKTTGKEFFDKHVLAFNLAVEHVIFELLDFLIHPKVKSPPQNDRRESVHPVGYVSIV